MSLHPSTPTPRPPHTYSLGRRLSYVFTGVVACIMLAFSSIVLMTRSEEMETRLIHQLERTAQLAENGLASAVWQFNPDSIDDVLQAIAADQSIVYVRVIAEGEVLSEHVHPDFSSQKFSFFEASSQFLTLESGIHYYTNQIGVVQLAISRRQIQDELTREILLTVVLTLVMILAISVTAFILTGRYLLHPLASLAESTALIANGNLEHTRISDTLLTSHQNEIGELAYAFDEMRERLQHVLRHIKQAGQTMQTCSDDMFTAVNQLAVALEEQSASVTQTTATMYEMTVTSRKISGNAEAVAKMADHTREHSQKGVAMAEETIRRMQDIQDTNTHFLQNIMALSEGSEKIGNVSNIINDIADQTKLIAFNAALEAVGVGDTRGKRFNVVAGEIRRLADSIITSIQDINTNIHDMQQGIRELVLSADTTTERIAEGAEQTETLHRWLQEIVTAANRTTHETRQIAQATQEQLQASEQIVFSLQEISEATRQYASAGGQLSESANDMKRMAQELHDLLEHYVIEPTSR